MYIQLSYSFYGHLPDIACSKTLYIHSRVAVYFILSRHSQLFGECERREALALRCRGPGLAVSVRRIDVSVHCRVVSVHRILVSVNYRTVYVHPSQCCQRCCRLREVAVNSFNVLQLESEAGCNAFSRTVW